MNMKTLIAGTTLVTLFAAASASADISIFGPGGPTPAMKEAATAFEAKTGIAVTVTAGPASNWMEEAKTDADAIYSGSQNMMDDFIASHGAIIGDSVEPLFLRPSAILVRKGNPKKINGISDLVNRDLGLMVVDGAGQVGMWEDVVGRLRDVEAMKSFRANIDLLSPNSGAARESWNSDDSIDAWLIWNHWQIDNPDIADLVPTEPELTIYRDTSIALTEKGKNNDEAAQFSDFLKSDEAVEIFAAHGWQRSID
jgi:accessory colonization factor AcfC